MMNGMVIPDSYEMETLEEEDFLELPEPESNYEKPDPENPWQQPSTRGSVRFGDERMGLSFPRGRAPALEAGVRTRNLDVGVRIGRKPNHQGRPDTNGSSGTKASNSMEEQMRRIQNRQQADKELEASRNALVQAVWEQGLDSIPYLPGRWTERLQEKVTHQLQECKVRLENAETLYASAEAKDKVPDIAELKEQLGEAQKHAKNTRQAWMVIAESEMQLQEAGRKGWPHGKAEFERANTLVQEARKCLLEIGEAGSDDSGRVRPREKMLNKRQLRVLTVRKECERRRTKVQVLLNRLQHPKWDTRYQAMLEMSYIGRQPVPSTVTFLGELVSQVNEEEWHENTGRGDSEVVAGILSMMHDAESEVRRIVVATLPRVCQTGDPVVLKAISDLTRDTAKKVKKMAMEAMAHLAGRGDAMVVTNMCNTLEDPDTAVRTLGVRLLPLVTQQPEDALAIDQVLSRLDHKRRPTEHTHWVTEERDVRLAALKALTLITPHGHDKTTRRVLMVLRNSWDVLIRDFTGCARDADVPYCGSIHDYGYSRGPLSLSTQLGAIERAAAGTCPAKCGEAAAAVRMAAIEVLVAIAVKRSDLAEQKTELDFSSRERLATAGGAGGRSLKFGSSPGSSRGGSLGGSLGGSQSASASQTPFSFSRGWCQW